jgi:hypothetical protein
VLEWQPSSEWGLPSFIIPKPKSNTVHLLSDYHEVNKRIVRKPFPLPKISIVFQEIEGFSYATTLDLNMGYYTIWLDPDASRVCTIIFPWGKYSHEITDGYCRLTGHFPRENPSGICENILG